MSKPLTIRLLRSSEQLTGLFEKLHDMGAKEFPDSWMTWNQMMLEAAGSHIDPSQPGAKELLTRLTLCAARISKQIGSTQTAP